LSKEPYASYIGEPQINPFF